MTKVTNQELNNINGGEFTPERLVGLAIISVVNPPLGAVLQILNLFS